MFVDRKYNNLRVTLMKLYMPISTEELVQLLCEKVSGSDLTTILKKMYRLNTASIDELSQLMQDWLNSTPVNAPVSDKHIWTRIAVTRDAVLAFRDFEHGKCVALHEILTNLCWPTIWESLCDTILGKEMPVLAATLKNIERCNPGFVNGLIEYIERGKSCRHPESQFSIMATNAIARLQYVISNELPHDPVLSTSVSSAEAPPVKITPPCADSADPYATNFNAHIKDDRQCQAAKNYLAKYRHDADKLVKDEIALSNEHRKFRRDYAAELMKYRERFNTKQALLRKKQEALQALCKKIEDGIKDYETRPTSLQVAIDSIAFAEKHGVPIDERRVKMMDDGRIYLSTDIDAIVNRMIYELTEEWDACCPILMSVVSPNLVKIIRECLVVYLPKAGQPLADHLKEIQKLQS